MSVTFDVKKEMDLKEWRDHCFGSGWTMWEWWYDANILDDGLEVQWYEDCDDPDSRIEKDFKTWQELADVASEVASWHQMVSDQLLNSDFDAVGMDVVMQVAFIGEITYG
jgi:hypothetical protein